MQPNPSYAPHIGSGSSQAYGSPAGRLAGPASFMGSMMGLGPKDPSQGPSQDPLQYLIAQGLLGDAESDAVQHGWRWGWPRVGGWSKRGRGAFGARSPVTHVGYGFG